MKKFICKVGIGGVIFACLLFLFEIAPAQEGIDFSVDNCSVEKIPGTDSVLVIADFQYLVATDSTDSMELHYVVKFNDELLGSGSISLPPVYGIWCWEGVQPCTQQGYFCPEFGPYRYCCAWHDTTCIKWCWKPITGKCKPYLNGCACYYSDRIIYWGGIILYMRGGEVTIILDDISAIPELDETNNECTTYYPPPPIPSLTEWGLIIFGVVLLGFITWVFVKRRKAVAVRV